MTRVLFPPLAAIAFAATLVGQPASAGDVKAGRQKALQCQTCHGLDGQSKIPEAPNLAGQNPVYLEKALKDYRTGARKNDMMSVVAPHLSDADISDLVAYFSGIEVTIGKRPQ